MKTNYVICCFGGTRMPKHRKMATDCTINVKSQVELLSTLKHDLDTITFVVNYSHDVPAEFYSYIDSIPDTLGGAKVEKIRRDNIGISYGAFSYIYDMTAGQYDAYFFSEDDFVFVQDNWDTKLFDMLEELQKEDPSYGYICALATPWLDVPAHASMPHGLILSSACEKVVTKMGHIPHSGVAGDYFPGQPPGQIIFSNSFYNSGCNIGDVCKNYKVGYINDEYGVWFGNKDGEPFCVPVDFLEPTSYPYDQIRHSSEIT